MDSNVILHLVFCSFIFCSLVNQNKANCPLPYKLVGKWWWDWTKVAGKFGNQARYVEVTTAGYERIISSQSTPDLAVKCDDQKAVGQYVVFAGSDSNQSNRRVCIQAYAMDHMVLWKQSAFTDNAAPYTATACVNVLNTPIQWIYMRKYPLSFMDSKCPFKSSMYQTEFSPSTQRMNQCRDDPKSITNVKDNYMEIQSCATESSTYENPYKGRLECVDFWSADVIGANPYDGSYIVLAYLDLLKEQVYNFYCGRYFVDDTRATVYISLYKASPFYANCQTDETAYTVSKDHVNIVLKSTICVDEKPCYNGATCEEMVGSFVCHCAVGYTGKDCSTVIDHCSPHPCENNGLCKNQPTGYKCECPDGYSGVQCQNKDHCYGVTCQNGARCVNSADGSTFKCNCVLGFTGRHCETDIDYCEGVVCQNGGVCVETPPKSRCNCTRQYLGENCETFDKCSNKPCKNGRCTLTADSFKCSCKPGYTGSLCDTVYDPCLPLPCQNNGLCKATGNKYSCDCPGGYEGTNCQESNFCGSRPCMNGATCTNKPKGYECICPSGYNGTTCDEPVVGASTLKEGLEMYRIIIVIVSIIAAMLIGSCLVIVIACIARRMRRKEKKYSDKLSEVRTLTRGSTRNSYVGSLASDRGSTWYPSYKNSDNLAGSLNHENNNVNPSVL